MVASFSERCVATPVSSQSPASTNCTTLSGEERLLTRQGSRLTPIGNSLLERHDTTTQSDDPWAMVISGIDILDESNPLSPTIRTFATVDNPLITCVVSGSDQVTRTERGIVSFTFNEPLNALYVLTRHRKMYYQFPAGVTPGPNSCVSPSVAASQGTPIVEDSTQTLIRVIGPFQDRSIQSSLPEAASTPAR
jgi:hypothetical protein